jgi:hypothetical protein
VLLEYDLRCAQLDLKQMRESTVSTLMRGDTPATAHMTPSSSKEANLASLANGGGGGGSHVDLSYDAVTVDHRDISESERAILNILVSKYLTSESYKLSAITFIEEVGSKQDLSNLEAYNLHIGNRASLLQLYRNRIAPNAEKIDMENELNELQSKLTASRMKIKLLEEDVDSLRGLVAAAKNTPANINSGASYDGTSKGGGMNTPSHTFDLGDKSTPVASSVSISAKLPPLIIKVKDGESTYVGDSAVEPTEMETGRMSTASSFDRRKMSSSSLVERSSSINLQLSPDDTYSDDGGASYEAGDFMSQINSETNVQALKALANALPSLISNVSLQARHELIPLISLVIKDHPDHNVREKLAGTLINLMKKPNHTHRQLILDALQHISSVGPDRVEHELLPALVVNFKGKYKEQKVLIAQGVGLLTNSIRPGYRYKLLAKLYTLLSDENSEVRKAVMTAALAMIKSLTPQEDSAEVVIGYVLTTLGDKCIPPTVQSEFLPLAITFINSLGLLWTNLLPEIIKLLIAVIAEPPSSDGFEFPSLGETKKSATSTASLSLLSSINTGLEKLIMSSIGPVKLDSTSNDAVYAILTNLAIMLPTVYDCMLMDAPLSSFPYADFDPVVLLNDILMGKVTLPEGVPPHGTAIKWSSLKWVILNLTVTLVGIAPLFDTASADGKLLKQALAQTIHAIGQSFGAAFVGRITYPLFLHLMGLAGKVTGESTLTPGVTGEEGKPEIKAEIPDYNLLTTILGPKAFLPVLTQWPLEPASAAPTDMKLAERVLPIFASGVLVDLDKYETQDFLRRSLIAVAIESKGWTSRQFPLIEEIFVLLCKHGNDDTTPENANICDTALNVLEGLCDSTRSKIRTRVVKLLGELIHVSSPSIVESRYVDFIFSN